MRRPSRILSVLVPPLLATACTKGGVSASSLYLFAPTKPVAVHVIIDYKLDPSLGPSVVDAAQSFHLNAFLLEDSEEQVAIGLDGGSATLDLPVALEGTHLAFDTVLQVPAPSKPGSSGYTFHFKLVERGGAGLQDVQAEESIKNLDALKGGVQPDSPAESNPVNLSLASTVAYQIVEATTSGADVASYANVLGLITESVNATEASLDTAASADLATLASAVVAGLKLKLTTIQDLQTKVAQALEGSSSGLEVKFTQLLKDFATEVKTTLGANDTAVAKVFKASAIDPSAIPNPDTYTNVIYAPASVTFTDEDPQDTVGGAIDIAAPQVLQGIESFNVYAARGTKPDAEKTLLGNVPASDSPLQLSLASGHELAAEQTHVWVYPVAGGTELDLGASTKIENLLIPSGLTYATVDAAYAEDATITPNRPAFAGATIQSYAIAPALPAGLAIDQSTGVISGKPTSPTATAEYVVTGSIGSRSTTTKLTIKVVVAPPAGLAYSVDAATYVVGTPIAANTTSSTGGAIAAYEVTPALPAGLSLDASTGAITGRPTATHARTSYTIKGQNESGSTTTVITVAVDPAPPASVALAPPAAVKSGTSFTLTGTCTGQDGSITVDVGNDGATTAGVSSDPLTCTCASGAFSCPAVSIDYNAYGSEAVSYKATISSEWSGSANQTTTNGTKVLFLGLSGAASIDDNDAYGPAGTCSPNGATVTVTAPAGFSPASSSCSCTTHGLSACNAMTETNASLNTALTVGGALAYAGQTVTASKALSVRNDPPDVLSSQSGAGYAYQTSQLGGLSYTRYGNGVPAGNAVSHLELADFIDDPVGNADGQRTDGAVTQRHYADAYDEGVAGSASITNGWTVSASNAKYADTQGEITVVSGAATSGDTYRGYFVPPQNGVYKFTVLSVDNSVRLMMSPDECPKDAVAVISADWAANVGAVDPASTWINGNGGAYADAKHYDHNTAVFFPGEASDPDYANGTTYLVANKIYYFEIRYGEGGGNRYFTFGMNRRDFGSATWDGVANLKAINMLPYEGADRYIPRQACGGSSYDAAQLFSDPEGDTLTFGAHLLASDGTTLPDAQSDVGYIGLAFNTATGMLTGNVNAQFDGQKIVFTARDATGSNETVSADPVTLHP